MKHKSPRPEPQPVSARTPFPKSAQPPTPPVEPLEVAGRHKNTGHKDHKGAR